MNGPTELDDDEYSEFILAVSEARQALAAGEVPRDVDER